MNRGDPGGPTPAALARGSSRHFILTAVQVSDSDWYETLDAFNRVRRSVLQEHGLPPWTELHAREIIHPRNSSPFRLIGNRGERVAFYREVLRQLSAALTKATIASVLIDKPESPTSACHYERAWIALLGHLRARLDSDGKVRERCLFFVDDTADARLRRIIRAFRHGVLCPAGAPTPGKSDCVIEDPVLRQSQHSFLVQFADLAAYALYLHAFPKGSLRRFGGHELHGCLRERMDPQLLSGISGVISVGPDSTG